MKNLLIKLFCKLLPIRKHPRTNQKRILIVSTTALGDTLWATPSIESLRKSFPLSYIGVLTSKIGFEVLKTNPYINKLHLLKEPILWHLFSLWRSLYREKFDTILIFHTSQRLVLPLCSSLGATQIIGTPGINKGLDDLLTDPIQPAYEHEILRRLRMVEKIGGEIHTEKLSFFSEAKEKSNPKQVALHPGSKDGFKRWPAKNFAEVGKILQEKFGLEILITGSRTELPLMKEVAQEIPGAKISEVSLPLNAFANLLSRVDLLITNDTGPVHLASALNIPTIALYASTDPNLCGPHKAERTIALYKPPTCTPCLKRKCLAPFCLLQIGVNDVIEKFMQMRA